MAGRLPACLRGGQLRHLRTAPPGQHSAYGPGNRDPPLSPQARALADHQGHETISYNRVADVPVANARTRIESSRGRGPRIVAAVQIVRTSGHRIQLPAPLVTASQGDPDFYDKVQLIKAHWQQAVGGTAGHLDQPRFY